MSLAALIISCVALAIAVAPHIINVFTGPSSCSTWQGDKIIKPPPRKP